MEHFAMVTTYDNPFNPWIDYEGWRVWDISHGYNTESMIAHFANYSETMGVNDSLIEFNRASDELIDTFGNKIWKKIYSPKVGEGLDPDNA